MFHLIRICLSDFCFWTQIVCQSIIYIYFGASCQDLIQRGQNNRTWALNLYLYCDIRFVLVLPLQLFPRSVLTVFVQSNSIAVILYQISKAIMKLAFQMM